MPIVFAPMRSERRAHRSQALPKHIEHFDLVITFGWLTRSRSACRHGTTAVLDRAFQLAVCPARPGNEDGAGLQYLTGIKFRQRVEAVIEKFEDMREDLDRERKFMGKQWSKREAQILAVGLYGGMVGDSRHRRQGNP